MKLYNTDPNEINLYADSDSDDDFYGEEYAFDMNDETDSKTVLD